MRKKKRPIWSEPETAAGNGLLDRRLFLTAGAAAIGSANLPDSVRAAEQLPVEPWMKTPGSPFVPYGQPSRYTSKVARNFASAPGTSGTGASRTPHHHLLDGGRAPREHPLHRPWLTPSERSSRISARDPRRRSQL